MTIIGTDEEIDFIKNQCNGRCMDGEWCIFGLLRDDCPVDNTGLCLAIGTTKSKDSYIATSVLNER